MDEAEDRIEKAEEQIRTVEELALEMLKLCERQDEKLTEMESRSRCENLRIYGVLEDAEKESVNMISFVDELLHECLQLPEEMQNLQIERAHRSLGPKPTANAPPRSIIVKLLSYRKK